MSRLERVLVGAFCVAVGWFCVWTARSNGDDWQFGIEQPDYYNLLIDGWLDGQLHMKVAVPEALLKLEDPYDPQLRPPDLGLHDATFYQGKYYVYFGAAPVVVLMLPFRVLTGCDLPLPVAVIVFVWGGFLASVLLLLALRRRCFSETRTWTVLVGVAVLGWASLGPVLVRRPQLWELPIAAGLCFAMLTLLAVWRSVQADAVAERTRWLAAAGLFLGLAIASRPTYLLASPLLAVPLGWWAWRERGLPWRPALGVVMPLAAIGALMAWHNFARFGDPLQFGQAYQFSLDYESKMAHFRAAYAPFNLWRYFFSAAQWSAEYPFIAPAMLPPKPAGFAGHDDVYGVLRNLPIAWFALAAPLALWRREEGDRARLAVWLAAAAVLFAAMAGVLLFFFGSLARYQLDFTPTLMLLATVGVLAVERWLRLSEARSWKAAVRVAWLGAAVVSVVFGGLFSVQLNRFLRHRSPVNDRALAQAMNRLPDLLGLGLGWQAYFEATPVARGHAMSGGRLLRLQVVLPAGTLGAREPLLTTGRGGAGDVLLVEYVDAAHVRFGFDHWGTPEQWSEPVAVDLAQPVNLEIGLPSLQTPAEPALSRPVERGRLFVRVNGKRVWAGAVEYYPAAADEVYVGRNPIGATSCGLEFTGKVLSQERAER